MKKIFICTILIVLSFVSGYILSVLNTPYKNFSERAILCIKKGESGKRISEELYEKGIILNQKLFYFLVKILGGERKLKSGYYEFKKPLSMLEVKKLLERGPNFFVKITVIEGENFFDIEKKIKNCKYLKANDFSKFYTRVDLLDGITNSAKNLEGYLFPDTYFFPPGYTSLKIIKDMILNFKRKVLPLLKKCKKGKDIHKILTIASLIEKETSIDRERKIISSVFYNRLKKNMRLQCDPTVIYARILKGLKFDGKIYKSDLKRKSPYNTYYIKGLPPGPICNPGLKSIEAACNPAETKYLYFVANGNGGHFFSKDLRNHLRAVSRFKKEKKR